MARGYFKHFSLLQESRGANRGLQCSTGPLYCHCILFFRSSFRVVHPLAIELPRSLGMVVTHWNLPMHLFLKNCEQKYTHRHTYHSCLPQEDINTCSKLHTISDLPCKYCSTIGSYPGSWWAKPG